MSVETGGRRRGFIARWLMRLEAAGSILRLGFLGVTAASTLTSALALIGLQSLAPWVLGIGIAGTLVFAWGYVELGIFNRKNRERVDAGNNFSRPDMYIDDVITAAGVFAAIHKRPPNEEESDALEDAVSERWSKHRNGIEL